LAIAPAVLSIAQHELGLALVYSAFLIAMYREGLPSQILIFGSSFAILVVATLLLDPNMLAISLTAIAGHYFFILRNQLKRSRRLLVTYRGHLVLLRRYATICSALYF
jgi:rod shape determining protein RodA